MGITKEGPSVYKFLKQHIILKEHRLLVYHGRQHKLDYLLTSSNVNGDNKDSAEAAKAANEVEDYSGPLRKGIVELASPTNLQREHYLPHHSVICPDQATSRVTIVV
uniref:Uncharacterized protein n=1 Tax=Amphimedon queenslandica TaxID=400682 RepID=A0A1X7VAC3_AMPQE